MRTYTRGYLEIGRRGGDVKQACPTTSGLWWLRIESIFVAAEDLARGVKGLSPYKDPKPRVPVPERAVPRISH